MDGDASKVLEFVRLEGAVDAIFIVFMTWLTSRLLRMVTKRVSETFVSKRLIAERFSAFARFFLYVVGAVWAIGSMFELSKELLTVVGGTIVVTVGLTLKDQASSVLAGILLLAERPFQVGDRVTFGSHYGEITNIGLRSVRLVTLDDNEITIPNNSFLTATVASGNSGALTMLVQQDFMIGVDQDFDRARRIVEDAVTSSKYFYANKPWSVLVNPVFTNGMPAIRLRAKAYVLELRFEKVFESDVAQRVLRKFREENVLPPALLYRALPNGAADIVPVRGG